MKIHTCEKCQSIPMYRLKQDGTSTVYYSCWSHMPRMVGELLGDTDTAVLIRRQR